MAPMIPATGVVPDDLIGRQRLFDASFEVEPEAAATYRACLAGFRVTEVPIVFKDRRVGESKMSRSIVAEAALAVPVMRMRGRRWS